ncbi:MAG: Polymorphic membrane protein, partial [Candidatus Moranbacteria bacterium GW2011_GWE2_35_164]
KILNLNRNKFIIFILIMFSGCFLAGKILGIDNSGDVIITEVMYDSEGTDNKKGIKESYEWIKLKNISNKKVKISNWEIRLGKFYKPFEGLADIPGNGEVVIYLGVGDNQNIDFESGNQANIYLYEILSKLGDSSGEVILYNGSGHNENSIIDYVAYGSINNNSTYYNQAIARGIWKSDCFLEDIDCGKILRVESNKCKILRVVVADEDNDNDKISCPGVVKINEIFPNPKEEKDEFIELYNSGDEEIDLGGWILKDNTKTKKYEIKSGSKIGVKNFFIINKNDSKIALNNSGEESVYLLNKNGVEVDKISYSDAKENFSYGYCEKTNKWRWSEFLTPGSKNEFREVGGIEIEIDEDIYRNVYANFEVRVSGIKDKNLKVRWEFGDGKNSYKNKTRHKYAKKGKYTIKLRVFDGSEEVKKEFNIEVVDFPEKKVNIMAINPNPEGKDSENEWIELKNKSKKKIDLKDWSVATGVNKKKLTNHPIYEEFIIKAGKIRQLTKDFSKFSLNNKKGYIELRSPDGEVVYDLKYKKEEGIGENEIFKKKDGGGWEWIKGSVLKLNKKEKEIKFVKGIETEKEVDVEIDKGELVRDMTPEDIGKYSGKEVENMIYNYTKEDLKNIQIKENSSLISEKQVLGVVNNKDKKIREAGGFYYFNPESKMEKHYLLKFFEKYFSNLV